MARLLVLRGDALDREIELKDKTLLLGRGNQNDVVLEDSGKSVSREHAEIRFEGGKYILVDLNSQNGVWVSGNRVPYVVLDRNVVASLGPFRLTVEAGASSATNANQGMGPDATTYGGETGDSMVAPPPPVRGPRPTTPPNWLARQPRWLLGTAAASVVGVLALGGALVMRQPRTDVRMIAANLEQAQALIAAGECGRAITEFLEPLVGVAESDEELLADVLDLRTAAETCVEQQVAAVPATSDPLPTPPVPSIELPPMPPPADPVDASSSTAARAAIAVRIPPAEGGLELVAGETPRQYQVRMQLMRARYDEALSTFNQGAFARAGALFEGIYKDAGGQYLDVADRLTQSKRSQADAARRLFARATELERSGDWAAAIQEYRRANEMDPNVSVAAEIARVNAQRTTAGESRCKEADAAYLYRLQSPRYRTEARRLYEEALKLLPPDHACAGTAKTRLAELR